jgi:hypothetical protein
MKRVLIKRAHKKHPCLMEQHLGRKLSPDEVVHHADMDVNNNNISNLELFDSKSSHSRFHWATNRRHNVTS